MSVEKNMGLIQRVHEEVNRGNFDVMDECFSDDFRAYHSSGMVVDRSGYKQAIKNLSTNVFPDIRRTIHDVIVTEDRAALFFTWTGTHTGEWRGKPPTGKKITVREIYFLRFKNDKITEYQAYGDAYGMYHKLGMTPPDD